MKTSTIQMKELEDKFDHIILTRFNVPSPGKESTIRGKPEWLSNRFKLFNKYCYPTVKNQSNQNFHWLIFFDEQTPKKHREEIKILSKYPNLQPIYVNEWHFKHVQEAITPLVSKDYILTTRLDNDDGLHKDFISTLQDSINDKIPSFYNFKYGLTLNRKQIYSQTHTSNAFTSRLELFNKFRTVWEIQHQNIIGNHKLQQIHLENAWLQVIHGENVSNCTRGKLTTSEKLSEHYPPSIIEELQSPSRIEILYDSIINQPLRRSRDHIRKIGKKLMLKH